MIPAHRFKPGDRVKYEHPYRETQYGIVSSVNDFYVNVKFDMDWLCLIDSRAPYTPMSCDACFLTILDNRHECF